MKIYINNNTKKMFRVAHITVLIMLVLYVHHLRPYKEECLTTETETQANLEKQLLEALQKNESLAKQHEFDITAVHNANIEVKVLKAHCPTCTYSHTGLTEN